MGDFEFVGVEGCYFGEVWGGGLGVEVGEDEGEVGGYGGDEGC